MGTQRPHYSSSSSSSISSISSKHTSSALPALAEQQCPLLLKAETGIQQSKGGSEWRRGREEPLDAEEKSWHNTFRPRSSLKADQ